MTLWLFSRFDWLEFLSHLFFFASFEYLQSLKCSATLSPESRQPPRVPKSSSITRRRQIGWWVYDGIRFEHPALLLLELLFNNFYAKGYHRQWGRTLRLKMSAKKEVCARKEKKWLYELIEVQLDNWMCQWTSALGALERDWKWIFYILIRAGNAYGYWRWRDVLDLRHVMSCKR